MQIAEREYWGLALKAFDAEMQKRYSKIDIMHWMAAVVSDMTFRTQPGSTHWSHSSKSGLLFLCLSVMLSALLLIEAMRYKRGDCKRQVHSTSRTFTRFKEWQKSRGLRRHAHQGFQGGLQELSCYVAGRLIAAAKVLKS